MATELTTDEMPVPDHADAPRLGGGRPVLGHALELRRDPLGLFLRGWREHGEVFEISALGRRFTVLLGPEAHEAYFRAPDDQLSQKEVYQFTVPIFGKGIAYDASPELMAEQVGFLYPAVRDGRMQTYASNMHREADAYAESWGAEGTVDLTRALNELTINISCRCLLGEEIRGQLHDGFDLLYRDLQGGINLIGFFFPNLPTPAHLRRDRARRKVVELIGEILAERRRTGRQAEDFMQTLLESRYADGRPLTDDEIAGILLTALFAGHHTSGVLGAWAGLEMAQHPEVLPAVREEIARIYGDDPTVTLAALKRQSRLDRAIREAERLHPPLIILVRKVLRDFVYKGHVLPAGTMAMVSPAAAHRLPGIFPDPDRYDPDRFLQPDGSDQIEPHTMITFGGGKHVCIGMHFAYMQLKVIWSVLLSRFEFELVSPAPRPDYSEWVTGPVPPTLVSYRRRERRLAL